MPQDKQSGAAASAWGHATARVIAERLGATGMSSRSNECQLQGKNTVIKCAGIGTRSVGVTYRMLTNLDQIVGAFEIGDGVFEVWSIAPEQFKVTMRETRSQGASKGKVALVERSHFERAGKLLGRITLKHAG
jgi:hypothetical protein